MDDNKRIAVNTIVLYIKFIITTVVSLVMSRLVLKALGASDYGLYNVVGGIVAMLNTLGTSMVATSYRYMAVEIGKGGQGNPNKVYNTVIVVHIALALLLLIVGETIGVFYVNNLLNVSISKIPDALFVLHLSLLTTAFSVITIPMNGLIIARERFLFTSVVESCSVIIKLFLVILLMDYSGNRLRLYAVFLAIAQFIVPLAYQIYCRVYDATTVKWNLNRNKNDYKELFSFASWILLGACASIGKIQGTAMIINYFFGTVLNAAFGLASQVSNAVSSFTATIRQAAIPQIMKSQGGGNQERSLSLVYSISRYSYLSMNIIAIPLLLCLKDVLGIWLGTPPDYTAIFVFFMIINGMISNLGAGFDASIQATGKIRKNQIGFSIINLALLPIIFILYRLHFPPYVNVICMVLLTFITLIFQISIMKDLTQFNIREYLIGTIKPSLLSTSLALFPLVLIKPMFAHNLLVTLAFLAIAVMWTATSIYLVGLTSNEQVLIKNRILSIFSKIKVK